MISLIKRRLSFIPTAGSINTNRKGFTMEQKPTHLFNSVPVCAVHGCANAGKRHTCPHDKRLHGHGRIHYDSGNPRHSLTFRTDGWHLICNEHFAVVLGERVEWERRELKPGDRVIVYNNKLSGQRFAEGTATLIRKYDESDRDGLQLWDVHFDTDDKTDTYPRWINPRDKTFEPKS